MTELLAHARETDLAHEKYFDPRGWLYLGEQRITARLLAAYDPLGAPDRFTF